MGQVDGLQLMALAEVREAGMDDAAVLGGLQLEFWRQAYAGLLPAVLLDRSDSDQADAWRSRLQVGGTALLATEGGAPVGFALLDPQPDSEGIGEIEALGVLLRWSRRGHGGRLLATAALHLRRVGATSGRYWAPLADEATAAFLTAAGWSPDGSRRILDTGEGTLTEQSYTGTLDLVLV
jgi:GNAT superfamily N-acetyltransferase